MALIDADASGGLEDRLAYFSFRFARCASLPCDDYGRLAGGFHKLRAGDYDLYVIADAPTADLVLKLVGLAGTTVIEPGEFIAREIAPFELSHNALSSGGHESRLRGEGFAFYSFALDAVAPHVLSAYGHCIHQHRTDITPVPYQPSRCPPVGGRGGVVATNGDGLRLTSSGIVPYLPAGIGVWHLSIGDVESVSALAVWIKTD